MDQRGSSEIRTGGLSGFATSFPHRFSPEVDGSFELVAAGIALPEVPDAPFAQMLRPRRRNQRRAALGTRHWFAKVSARRQVLWMVAHYLPLRCWLLPEDDWLGALSIKSSLHLDAAFPAFIDHLVLVEACRRHRGCHVRRAHGLLACGTVWGFWKKLVLRDQGGPPWHRLFRWISLLRSRGLSCGALRYENTINSEFI